MNHKLKKLAMRTTFVLLGVLLFSGCQPTRPRDYVPLTIGMSDSDLRLACDDLRPGELTIERNGAKWYWTLCFRHYQHYASVRVVNSVVETIAIKP